MTNWIQTFKNIGLFHKANTITIPTEDCEEVAQFMIKQQKQIEHQANHITALKRQLDMAQNQLLERALSTLDQCKPQVEHINKFKALDETV